MPTPSLEFLHANHAPRCRAVVDKRFPDYCSLQLITGGSIDLKFDQHAYRLSGRWVWLSYPGPWIHFESSPGCDYWVHRHAAFRGPLMMQWFDSGLLPFEPQRAPARGNFMGRFDELIALVERRDDLGRRRAANVLEGLLLELADHRRSPQPQWLDHARQLLLQAKGQRPDYQRIADELGMGLSTFRRTFRQQAGMSVHQFVLRRRLDTAMYLLSETRVPIKSIARQLGYRDVFFFTRQFTQAAGLPPARYRAQHTGDPSPSI